jgi:hypothetical protein
MPDRRKPPVQTSSRPGNRHDVGTLPSDSGAFSIESTTMRLKSLRLRRAEVANQEVDNASKSPAAKDSEVLRDGPSGRVRHDERGVAVWDWAVASGEFATLSATRALKKLEVAELKIEDHEPAELKLEVSGRDKAGGFDPYNQRGSGKRQGEAAARAGVTGSARADGVNQLTEKKK